MHHQETALLSTLQFVCAPILLPRMPMTILAYGNVGNLLSCVLAVAVKNQSINSTYQLVKRAQASLMKSRFQACL